MFEFEGPYYVKHLVTPYWHFQPNFSAAAQRSLIDTRGMSDSPLIVLPFSGRRLDETRSDQERERVRGALLSSGSFRDLVTDLCMWSIGRVCS